jgi:hypothetical protein
MEFIFVNDSLNWKNELIPKEIHHVIIDYCEVEYYYHIMRINKYWNELITNKILFIEWNTVCHYIDKHYDPSTKSQYKFYAASKLGTKVFFDYLIDNIDITNTINIHQAFIKSCENGHLHIAKKIAKIRKFDLSNVFFRSLYNSHMNVVEWLIQLGCQEGFEKININTNSITHCLAKQQCMKSLKSLKILAELSRKSDIGGPLDIHVHDEALFRYFCNRGNLELAKFTFELGNDPYFGKVDIHAHKEYAFRESCIRGHIDVAKWLLTIGDIDIHIMNNYVYKMSPHPVIEWLNTLDN